MLEPLSGVGEGCSGLGARTHRPGGSGGRGSLPPPAPDPFAHALREEGGWRLVTVACKALWGLECTLKVNLCSWRLLAHISHKPLDQIGACLAAARSSVEGAVSVKGRGLVGWVGKGRGLT